MTRFVATFHNKKKGQQQQKSPLAVTTVSMANSLLRGSQAARWLASLVTGHGIGMVQEGILSCATRPLVDFYMIAFGNEGKTSFIPG